LVTRCRSSIPSPCHPDTRDVLTGRESCSVPGDPAPCGLAGLTGARRNCRQLRGSSQIACRAWCGQTGPALTSAIRLARPPASPASRRPPSRAIGRYRAKFVFGLVRTLLCRHGPARGSIVGPTPLKSPTERPGRRASRMGMITHDLDHIGCTLGTCRSAWAGTRPPNSGVMPGTPGRPATRPGQLPGTGCPGPADFGAAGTYPGLARLAG
jgi:hypothetical protein